MNHEHPSTPRTRRVSLLTLLAGALLLSFLGLSQPEPADNPGPVSGGPSSALPADTRPTTPEASPELPAAPLVQSESEQVETAQPERRIEDWLEAYRNNPVPSENLLAEGRRIAEARRERMATLIAADPDAALAAMLPLRAYLDLPESIRSRIEQPFSAAAELTVVPFCPTPGYDPHVHGERDRTEYWTAIDGRALRVYPAGDRREIYSKNLTSVSGIRLDGKAALQGSAVWPIPPSDAEPAARLIGLPQPAGPATQDPAAAVVAGRLVSFADPAEMAALEDAFERLERAPDPRNTTALVESLGDGGAVELEAEGDTVAPASPWTESPMTMLFIRIDFDDIQGEPVSVASLEAMLGAATPLYEEMSYGKTTLVPTVTTQVYRLGTSTSYSTTDNYGQLGIDARAAASADYVIEDYDVSVYCFPRIFSGWSGRAGGSSQWLNGSFGGGVFCHETGHNYGLKHASAWETADGSNPADPGGSIQWYGNYFDMMGSSGSYPTGHFNSLGKRKLEWVEASDYVEVSVSGIYRIHRHDHIDSRGGGRLLGCKIQTSSGSKQSIPFWLSYRTLFTSDPDLRNHILMAWDEYTSDSGAFGGVSDYRFLDSSPGSSPSTYSDRRDGGLGLNETFTDPTGLVNVTPIASGGTPPYEWIDVEVVLGVPGNSPPSATSIEIPGIADARSPVSFAASGTDPDGDSLVYVWDFGDGNTIVGGPAVEYTYPGGGTFDVTVQISDEKGGDVFENRTVRVIDPIEPWTEPDSGITDSLRDVIFAHGRFLAAGAYDVFWSTDGLNWKESDTSIYGYGLGAGPDGFRVVGQRYNSSLGEWEGAINFSSDGLSWSLESIPDGMPRLSATASGNGIWVAVGGSGTIVKKTGVFPWSVVPSPTSEWLDDTAYGNGVFLAVGANNTILRSSDGINWSDVSTGSGLRSYDRIYEVAYADGSFVISGYNSVFRISHDNGTTWTGSIPFPPSRYSDALAFDGSLIFRSGYYTLSDPETHQTTYYYQNGLSTEGSTWGFADNRSSEYKNAATFGAGRIVVVGNNGLIQTSNLFDPANQFPSASLSGPATGAPGETVLLTASGSDPDGDSLSFFWLEDGAWLPGGTDRSVTLPSGSTTYRVRAYDSRGGVAEATHRVESGGGNLAEAADTQNLDWATEPDRPWASQTAQTHDLEDALASADIGDNQTTWLTTTVEGPGILRFWWKVSSEANWDFLRYYLDEAFTPSGEISGEQDWQEVTLTLGEGSHTIRWEYYKDGSISNGADRGYLDQVSFTSTRRFALEDFSKDPYTLSLSFPSRVGHGYTVEGTSGFDVWGEVETGIMGTGTVLHRTYALPADEPDYFFRVSESP